MKNSLFALSFAVLFSLTACAHMPQRSLEAKMLQAMNRSVALPTLQGSSDWTMYTNHDGILVFEHASMYGVSISSEAALMTPDAHMNLILTKDIEKWLGVQPITKTVGSRKVVAHFTIYGGAHPPLGGIVCARRHSKGSIAIIGMWPLETVDMQELLIDLCSQMVVE